MNKRTVSLLFILLGGISRLFAGSEASLADLESQLGGYPRLSMWWPNSWEQSIEDLARYDYIAWGNWENEETLAQLKEINPHQIHFSSITSTEVMWQWFIDEEYSSVMVQIPAEWFLTQQGSVLRESIGPRETRISVEATRNEQGESLFEKGDTLVCGSESMEVRRVIHRNSELVVQRGFYRPASAHERGTRVAAHISFWPETWVMNVSKLCPVIEALETDRPAERWSDWAVDVLIPKLFYPQRDGYLADRVEYQQSWLIPTYARSMDPRCLNQPPSLELYEEMDVAWLEGQQSILLALRESLSGKPLVANSFGMYSTLLNGTIYESCPGNWVDDRPESWEDWAAGARPYVLGEEGYIAVSQSGYFPNFSTVETYEIETMPQEGTDNPMDDPNWQPDYQRMRWGLSTALLGDGFFSYEIATWGHGTLGLLWFDEYDNAGEGRGYLGMPLSPAEEILDLGSKGKVYRRDYQEGIVLCNPSEERVVISLEEPYRLIRGEQVPSINTGELVVQLELAPRDGRILLREP